MTATAETWTPKKKRGVPPRPVEDRVFGKIWQIGPDPVISCWLWTGSVARGYGKISVPGRVPQPAHRITWEIFHGPIPDGLVLDHLCRNRRCVNPWHLDPVTHLINVRRGVRPPRPSRTHCKWGHPWVDFIVRPDNRRECRPCNLRRGREYRANRQAAA